MFSLGFSRFPITRFLRDEERFRLFGWDSFGGFSCGGSEFTSDFFEVPPEFRVLVGEGFLMVFAVSLVGFSSEVSPDLRECLFSRFYPGVLPTTAEFSPNFLDLSGTPG